MNNAKLIAIAFVLTATLACSFSVAKDKTASSRPVKVKPRRSSRTKVPSDPKAYVAMQVRRYAVTYGLNKAEQAKIEKVLLAQQKDLADLDRSRGLE